MYPRTVHPHPDLGRAQVEKSLDGRPPSRVDCDISCRIYLCTPAFHVRVPSSTEGNPGCILSAEQTADRLWMRTEFLNASFEAAVQHVFPITRPAIRHAGYAVQSAIALPDPRRSDTRHDVEHSSTRRRLMAR
jgi:hypothetical protein